MEERSPKNFYCWYNRKQTMAKIRTGKVMAFLKVYKEFITRIIPGFRGVPRAWLPPPPPSNHICLRLSCSIIAVVSLALRIAP